MFAVLAIAVLGIMAAVVAIMLGVRKMIGGHK
jgi:hypothetical protein